MIIYISGQAPNTAITLQAECQAERDQIERLKREAKVSRAELVGLLHDPADTMRLRVESSAQP